MEFDSLPFPYVLLGSGMLLLLALLACKASVKLGIPALLLFIGIGMLAGSDGPGGLAFDNAHFAQEVGTVALALILFAGGLESDWREMRKVLWPAVSLATLGVGITAVVVGVAAYFVLHMPPIIALLMGALVSSTDASAVFGVVKARKMHLKDGLMPLLEFESGGNDPMAVFLTVGLTGLAAKPDSPLEPLVVSFVLQMVIGVAVGFGVGKLGEWLICVTKLEIAGLYPTATIGVALVSFGGSEVIHGNPFLAVYICGMTLGYQSFPHKNGVKSFHDGLGWLMQMIMFILLGILVFPRRLLPLADEGLILSVVLVLVARPIAVLISTCRVKWLTFKDKLFISWVGLRGAVPIILATIPLTAGIHYADALFNVVFFAVLTSVLVQGTLIGKVASWLGVLVTPHPPEPSTGHMTGVMRLLPSSPAVGKQVVDLELPNSALMLSLERGGETLTPDGSTVLMAGDEVMIVTRKNDLEELTLEIVG